VVAKLYTQTLGGAPTAILAPAEVTGALHGRKLRFRAGRRMEVDRVIGGLMSDQVRRRDVWSSRCGGAPVDLTRKRPTSPAWIEWDGNEHLYISELAAGNAQLVRMASRRG